MIIKTEHLNLNKKDAYCCLGPVEISPDSCSTPKTCIVSQRTRLDIPNSLMISHCQTLYPGKERFIPSNRSRISSSMRSTDRVGLNCRSSLGRSKALKNEKL